MRLIYFIVYLHYCVQRKDNGIFWNQIISIALLFSLFNNLFFLIVTTTYFECASEKKIEQALFFPLGLHYLCTTK